MTPPVEPDPVGQPDPADPVGQPDAAGPVEQPDAAGPEVLDEGQRRILEFERRWWRRAGAKEQAILDVFGFSPTRYHQLLNALLDEPAALAFDPVLVNRLRRLRAGRTLRGY
jgi:Protein of unknown function (DUF3263)